VNKLCAKVWERTAVAVLQEHHLLMVLPQLVFREAGNDHQSRTGNSLSFVSDYDIGLERHAHEDPKDSLRWADQELS
jgi:hypothetical protein